MALINPGPNPTWAEVQAGIEANAAERQIVDDLLTGAQQDIKDAELIIRQQQGALRQITNNLRRWLEAISDLAGDD